MQGSSATPDARNSRSSLDKSQDRAEPAFPTLLNPALATTKSSKLGVFSGVFVPCVLSIWGIILFLRFGFIIAQAGVMGTMAMFIVGYAINIFTTLSLSAISTNGTVRGGGVYYLLSRSLGPEFGGSIGLIYFLGTVIGCGMNVLGFVEPLISNFGESSGTVYRVLPEGPLWGFVYGTILLVSCTLICLVGSKLFSRASLVLAVIILLSTLSIFVSFAVMPPFTHLERNIDYTGFSWETLQENMWPKFTATNGLEGPKESFETVFGVLFPACIGILAGASMSGDLEDPSKSIPKGTLWAVGSTFCVYTCIVILMGGSISRSTMYTDLSVLQDVSVSPLFIASGALAASVFATLGSVIGAAKILQAIARDNLLPLLSIFGQGTPRTDEPTLAVLLTYILCQFCLFLTDMNAIATFVSMITLLTFLILNLACFLLKIGSAPNFRPSFRFFHWWTAFGGMVLCALVMGSVDLGKSLLSGLMTAVLFIWIHYWSPPKRWGDVTQSLIYHQVRKYLLRLDSRKEHVKFWRPQILLLVHHPRSEYHLIQFCNHLKKGALYVLGHVILGDLRDVLAEYRRQQGSWLKFVDVLQIKAFVNLSVADSVRIGARNLLIGTGLGGMRPNIVVMGSFNLERYLRDKQEQELRQQQQQSQQLLSPRLPQSPLAPQKGVFPTLSTINNSNTDHTLLNIPVSLPIDNIRVEAPIKITDYVSIIEDVLSLNKAVAIGYGFERLDLPEEHKSMWKVFSFGPSGPSSPFFSSSSRPSSVYKHGESRKKKYIDLWPMQMSIAPLQCYDAAGPSRMADANLTNFDTYTMVLQMGCILHMVPHWKENFTLRVMVFVEFKEDVEEEKKRLKALLENLRIPAEVKVMCLDGGDSETYDRLIKGEGLDEYPIEDMAMEYNSEEGSDSGESESPAAPTGPYSNVAGQRDLIRTKDSAFAQRSFGSRGQNVPVFQASAPPPQMPQRRRTISHPDRPPIRASMSFRIGLPPPRQYYDPNGSNSDSESDSISSEDDEDYDQNDDDLVYGGGWHHQQQQQQQQQHQRRQQQQQQHQQQQALLSPRLQHLSPRGQRQFISAPTQHIQQQQNTNTNNLYKSLASPPQHHTQQTPLPPTSSAFAHTSLGSDSSNAWNSSGLLAPEAATAGVAPYTMSPPNGASHLAAPSAATAITAATAVGDPHSSSSYSNSSTSSISPIQPAVPMFAEGFLPIDTTTIHQQPSPPLQFDHLNPEAQLMILNELMRIHSSAETTSIVFTTVPAPEEGTCLREESSLAYLEQLDLLMEGIDIPVLLIHAKSLTVTMTL
ncbi:MAG: amino acid permease-domain-containing protein [Linnemannia elongata]|nr:MAG: amino acid permease-domain-containing protein [Linnemannia elongata]